MTRRFKLLVIASVLATSSLLAAAQSAGNMPCWGGKHNPAQMEKMHAKHLTELKDKLKLTAAQESAWTTFAAATKPAPGEHPQRPDFAAMDQLSTPERIDKMRALRKEHMSAMDSSMTQREEATKAFYAVLNADQKKTFDTTFAKHFRPDHRMHGGDADTKPAN